MRPGSRLLSILASRLEIERKFHPTRLLFDALTSAIPSTRLASSAALRTGGVHFVRDVYYDCASTPTDLWEAKIRVGGTFAAFQFVRVQGNEAVERKLLRVLGPNSDRVDLEKIDELDDLGVMCDLTTRRLEGRLEEDGNDENNDALRTLDIVIDQVVRTPRGDFPAARAMLERLASSSLPSSSASLPPHPFGFAAFFHEIGKLEIIQEVRNSSSSLRENEAAQEHDLCRETVAPRRAAHESFMRTPSAAPYGTEGLKPTNPMFFRALTIFALVFAAAATECPACPATDLAGNALTAQSGGTLGTPRFCGYGAGVSVECFYEDGSGIGTGPGATCPATAPIEDVC
ncbi:hypothetical protein K438DRAFT_1957396 [Mycena galopus ATCC 62051]|nr:hypothetical protein K438DRAFT_1957396 [Mycena galopus ATCC 62051]